MYFSFDLVKAAFNGLVKLDSSDGKSRKEKISGLRYLIATSQIIVQEKHSPINLEVGSNLRNQFLDAVGSVVALNDSGLYTKDSTFEKYLLNSLRKNKNSFASPISVLDGNSEGRKKFYNQPSRAQGDAKPDIIISRNNNAVIIADAKYKNKSKDTDRYQVISHALSYNCKIAVLVLPKDKNHTGRQLIKSGDIGIEYIVEVYEYYFDLSSNDLDTEEQLFSKALSSLISE